MWVLAFVCIMSTCAVVFLLPVILGVFVAAGDDGYQVGGDLWEARSKSLWRSKYPEEFEEGHVGDIAESTTGRKNGLRAAVLRWPDAVIPYFIQGPYTLEQCKLIESAFEMYQKHTCVRFRLKTEQDKDYVIIVNENGCFAELGRVGGEQTLNIGEGPCVNRGTVMHELMHVLGFMHEQKRNDRDSYIKVIYENLRTGKEDNFNKQSNDTITSFGVSYDYDSITHYSPLAFSKNGQPTVKLLRRVNANIGQRDYLSAGDVAKINRMYNCTQATVSRPTYPTLC